MYVLGNSYCPLCIYTTKHAKVNMKNKKLFLMLFLDFFWRPSGVSHDLPPHRLALFLYQYMPCHTMTQTTTETKTNN